LKLFRTLESARQVPIRQWNTDKREIKNLYENKEHEIKSLIEKNDKKKKRSQNSTTC